MIEQAKSLRGSRSEWTRRGWCARIQSIDSSADESLGRKTQETAGLDVNTGYMVGSTLSKLLVQVQNSKRMEDAR